MPSDTILFLVPYFSLPAPGGTTGYARRDTGDDHAGEGTQGPTDAMRAAAAPGPGTGASYRTVGSHSVTAATIAAR
jgi:hypothetical protein